MAKRNLTYSELVSECIDDINRLYARCGGLRDAAEGYEKDAFNNGRGALGLLLSDFFLLRDMINASGRGEMKLGDWTGEAALKQ